MRRLVELVWAISMLAIAMPAQEIVITDTNTQIVGTYPRELAAQDRDKLLAYARTLALYTTYKQQGIAFSPAEMFNYYRQQEQLFKSSNSAEFGKSAVDALSGLGKVAEIGLGLATGGELTAARLLMAMPGVTAGGSAIKNGFDALIRNADLPPEETRAMFAKAGLMPIAVAGILNEDISAPLLKYILTGQEKPDVQTVKAVWESRPITKVDLRETADRQGLIEVLLGAIRANLKKSGKTDEEIAGILKREVLPKLDKLIADVRKLPELLGESRQTAHAKAIHDQYLQVGTEFFSIVRGLNTLFPTGDPAGMARFISLSESLMKITAEAMGPNTNPVAIASGIVNMIALLCGSSTEPESPFKVISEQLKGLHQDIMALRTDLRDFREDVDRHFRFAEANLAFIEQQLRETNTLMSRQFDDVLTGMKDNQQYDRLRDWKEFESSARNYREAWAASPDKKAPSVQQAKFDSRNKFARLIIQIEPGNAGFGHSLRAGNPDGLNRHLENIRKSGLKEFENVAARLATNIESPSYEGNAYPLRDLILTAYDALPDLPDPRSSVQRYQLLPGQHLDNGSFRAWKSLRNEYAVGTPTDAFYFLNRIVPVLQTLPPDLRAEFSGQLIKTTAPILATFSATNSMLGSDLLVECYDSLAVELERDIDALFFNRYIMEAQPIGQVARKVVDLFPDGNAMQRVLYPVPADKSVYQVFLDIEHAPTSDAAKARMRAERAAFERRGGEIVGSSQDLLRTIDTAFGKLASSTQAPSCSSEPIDVVMTRWICQHAPPAFKENANISQDAKVIEGLKKTASALNSALVQGLKCIAYAHPQNEDAGDRYDTTVINKVPDDCKKMGDNDYVRPDKRAQFSYNAGMSTLAFVSKVNEALETIDDGLDGYLQVGPTEEYRTSRAALATRILRKALALRFVEVLLQRRVQALEGNGGAVLDDPAPLAAPKNWHSRLRLSERYKAYLDFLLNGADGKDNHKAGLEGDSGWPRISRFSVPRIEWEEKAPTINFATWERRQYATSLSYGPMAQQPISMPHFKLTKVFDSTAEQKTLQSQHDRQALGLRFTRALLDNPKIYGKTVNPVTFAVGQYYDETKAVLFGALADPEVIGILAIEIGRGEPIASSR